MNIPGRGLVPIPVQNLVFHLIHVQQNVEFVQEGRFSFSSSSLENGRFTSSWALASCVRVFLSCSWQVVRRSPMLPRRLSSRRTFPKMSVPKMAVWLNWPRSVSLYSLPKLSKDSSIAKPRSYPRGTGSGLVMVLQAARMASPAAFLSV